MWCRDGTDICRRERSPEPFAELLIDCEEDRDAPGVLVGMLREAERGR